MIFRLLCIAATYIAATSAWADDFKPSTGFYIAPKIGLASLSDPALTSPVTVFTGDLSGNTTNFTSATGKVVGSFDTRNAMALGLELGYDFGNIRFGLDLRYQNNKAASLTVQSVNDKPVTSIIPSYLGQPRDAAFVDANTAADIRGLVSFPQDAKVTIDKNVITSDKDILRVRQIAVLATLYYDIPIKALPRLNPYVGAGVGVVGLNYRTSDGRSGYEDDGLVKLGWQLAAGVSYALNNTITASLDYSFRNAAGGQFRDDKSVTTSSTKSHNFGAGLRFTF